MLGSELIHYDLSIYHTVAVRLAAGDECPILHPFLPCPSHIPRDRFALLLGERSKDGQHHLTADAASVNVFFLEVNADAHGLQLSHRL